MNAKKQMKKMIKTVEKNPAAVGAIVTGALAMVGTAGMVVRKMKSKKTQK
ncbi:MAG: hypothetical protein IJY08_06300 [Clostridia bacterium]|nr:hypothetical protein [Clostridia bacterium]